MRPLSLIALLCVGLWPILVTLAGLSTSPPKSVSDSWRRGSTELFVGISAFRDKRCSETLKDVFGKAKYPSRITVGVLEHIHTENDVMNCVKDYCHLIGASSLERCPYRGQIKLMDDSFLDAKGPGVSRVMQEQLLGDEEFCLQVDSHTKFVKNWDEILMNTWAAADNEYGIISTVPPSISAIRATQFGESVDESQLNHVCSATFTNSGIVRNLLPSKIKGMEKPTMSAFWSAAFSFSKCHAVRKVPHDPNYHYILDGEEFSHMARLWTRGYDVYSPNKVIVAHDYNKHNLGMDKASKSIDANSWAKNGQTAEYRRVMYDEAVYRMRLLLGSSLPSSNSAVTTTLKDSLTNLQQFGLGVTRTLDEFIEFTGIDTKSNKILGDRCKPLKWVPFSYNGIDPALDPTDIWGMAPETLVQGGNDIPISNTRQVIQMVTEDVSEDSHGSSGATNTIGEAIPATPTSKDSPKAQLWWIFRPIDWMLESVVDRIESIRPQAGIRLMKVILLGFPLIFILLGVGVFTLVSLENGSNNKEDFVEGPTTDKMV